MRPDSSTSPNIRAPLCSVCGRPILTPRPETPVRRRLCCSHACAAAIGNRDRRLSPEAIEALFWSQVEKTADCWLFCGRLFPSGYGQFCYNGRSVYAHRYASELVDGPIPAGLYVCHRCDNPPCVRPAHLFRGTPRENVADMIGKGRRVVVVPPPRVGTACNWARLTEERVAAIRRDYAPPAVDIYDLARRENVTPATVSRVLNRLTWKHVP